MAYGLSFVRPSGLLLLVGLFLGFGWSYGTPLTSPLLTGQRLSLQPWCTAWEDSSGLASADNLIRRPGSDAYLYEADSLIVHKFTGALVNEKLFPFEKGSGIGLCEFISDLAGHLQKIYDTKEYKW
jgi:hypothetical protein